MSTTALEYCGEQVRRHDRDRYLTSLSAPVPARHYLFALFAFNLEVAKTADVVSEAMLGRIRLQWWREALDELFAGTPRKHEVVNGLAAAHAYANFDRNWFEHIIVARELDLDAEAISTPHELEHYASATAAAPLQLAAAILSPAAAAHEAAIDHAGTAYALARLLRAVPFHANRGRIYLPQTLLAHYGVGASDLAVPRQREALSNVVREVATLAAAHLSKANEARERMPKALLPVMLHAALADYDLRLLEARDYDVFAPPPASENWRRPLLLAWRGWRGRY